MSFKVWAVFQQAVYRHDCIGIFTNPDSACAAAKAAAQEDVDAHHSYDVVPFVLNKRLPWQEGTALYARYVVEAEPIASYRKEIRK